MPMARARQQRPAATAGRVRALAAAAGLSVSVLALPGVASAAPQDYLKIALTGETAAGAPSAFAVGFDGRGFSNAVINNWGQVAYAARLNGQFGSADRGVFLNSESLGQSNRAVAVAGSSAANTTSNHAFGSDPIVTLSRSGHVAFLSDLTGGGATTTNDQGVFVGDYASTTLVAREDDAAPSIANVRYGATVVTNAAFQQPVISAEGVVAFRSNLRGASLTNTNDSALWSGLPGAIALVAREGSVSTLPGVNYGVFGGHAINESGRSVVRAALPLATTNNDEAFFTLGPGGNSTVTREGNVAPGAGTAQFSAGLLISRMGEPALNNTGRVAFRSALTAGGVGTANDSGVWAGTPPTGSFLQLVVRENTVAPSLGGVVKYDSFDDPLASDVVMNASGSLAMVVKLRDGGTTVANDTAIYTGPTLNTLVAREGAAVPGIAGVNFGLFNDGAPIAPCINDDGSVLFKASLAGVGVSSSNDSALFGFVPNVGFFTLIREGEQIDVNGMGDLRTVSQIDVRLGSGGEDGRGSALDDFGRVVFSARFTDGSAGVFVTQIPGPSAAGAFALALSAGVVRRGRRSARA